MNRQTRFLILSYYFAPSGGPRSIRWTNISRYLADAGNTLTIICARFPGDCENIDRSLSGIANHQSINIQPVPIGVCNPGLIGNIRWTLAAVLAALRLPPQSFDIVISSALPIWSHIAARILLLARDAKPWIADYGDPWSTSEIRAKSGIRRTLEKSFEKLILRRANLLTVTTEQACDIFSTVFPRGSNIKVIPQGASMFHITADWSKSCAGVRDLFRILYAGGFYPNQREPGNILRALADLEEVELRIVGIHQMDVESSVQNTMGANRISVRGYIPLKEVVEEQQRADLLLLLSYKVADRIPGKLYEYLATGKPILYVTDHLDDEVVRIIHSRMAGYVCRNTVWQIRNTMLEILREWHSGEFRSREPVTDAGFDRRAISYAELAESLIDEHE
jgi:glycosyltransferase involved in cell wall biosynthesis